MAHRGFRSFAAIKLNHLTSIRRVLDLLIIWFVLAIYSFANAHNRVAFLPMGGDEVAAKIIASSPIADVSTSAIDYTINGFFSVTDNTTGLYWQRGDYSSTGTWIQAREYCANLNLDGHQDWRLPSHKELHSIVNYGTSVAPLIASSFITTNAARYWSSTTRVTSAGLAWYVDFNIGVVFYAPKSTNNYVRCVRL